MWKKSTIVAMSSLLLAGVLPASTNAAVETKNVQAIYHDIKIRHNGVVVPTQIEPFIINGTTYVPLRMMTTLFNKNIAWNGTTYTIDVTDIPDTRIAALEAEIARKNSTIESLEKQLKDAKDRLNQRDDEDDVQDQIDELEDDLNDDYGDYEGLEWDIKLDGDEDNIEVEIEIDLGEYQDDWENLSKGDKEELVEDICDDIWNEFEDAEIEGTIYDTDDDDELHEFSGDPDDEDVELD
ncbi:copper amine oxidase N-terminal domain-containing protein [Brevibacillus humidisoli]|uniref:stalk domain-containing protein n=1 Tax=Brevibacillus humidisoli TaxID=2895522 RepID=UPI001E42B5A9|nr:stalk domain-containing protein [Brevibacillus humidisoli]UFJ42098.1 copper amine oxidase N-terminal domain-containing protein [Brevibacillus humidisoli]